MTSNAKQIVLAHDIAAQLGLRNLGLTITETFDGSGNPTITVGTNVAGAAGAFIRVIPQSWPLAVDILGLTQNVFCPSITQVVFELNPTAGAGADVNSLAVLVPILGECIIHGASTEVYTSANGTAPSAAAITGGNLKSTFNTHTVYGMIANQ